MVAALFLGRRSPLGSKISFALAVAIGLLTAIHTTPAWATILSGQVDDFQGGALGNWNGGGAANPNGPANIASGGPAGASDRYLQLTSNGGLAGGKLVVFNANQWAGDYLTAGVSAISADVNNVGNTDLVLRLILLDSLNNNLTTSSPVNVAAGSGWQKVSFSLASGNLSGTGVYNTLLAHVAELDLVHSPSIIGARSSAPTIVAQLGVDNITAVPEPSGFFLAGVGTIGLIGWAWRQRKRSGSPGSRAPSV